MSSGPVDHGNLDYVAMGFVLLIFLGLWMWLNGWPETTGALVFRLVMLAIGGVGLFVSLWLKRKWS